MSKGKKIKKIVFGFLIAVVALIAVAAGVWFLALNPYRGNVENPDETLALDTVLTKEQAKEDIDYVMEMYRDRHPAWLEDGNERVANVEAQYLKELELLDSMTDEEVTVLAEWQMISRIMHELYDGHSNVYTQYNETICIDDYTYFYEYGLPAKIGDLTFDEALEKFKAVYQYETDAFAKIMFIRKIIGSEACLRWIGYDTSEGIDMTFDTKKGEEVVHFNFVPYSESKKPEYSPDEEDRGWVYYDIDTENGIGIFSLESCQYNDEYKKVVKEFFKAVDEAGIEHIIIDLRNNGGGSSMVADHFLRYVDIDGFYTWADNVRVGDFLIKDERTFQKNGRLDPQYSGDLYVLTNTLTYSAAMDFTMDIMDNDLGTVVGEASGNLPDSYGDILCFQTPNSHLQFSISYKRWFRTDESKTGQPLEPDYPCPSEEAMDKAYELILNS